MRISYAQCLEDFHLDRVLGARKGGFYVDIGGGHPVADNVSFHFYLKGWHGLVVEPQEDLAALYSSIRPRDRVAAHLVGRGEGEVAFHRVDRLHGFSTMVETHARGAAAFGAGYATMAKRVRPLSALLDDMAAPHVDFLKVDVEGAEADVLAGIDWTRHRPSVLCVEAVAPGSMAAAHDEWEPALVAADYLFVFSDGLNRFYVAEAEKHLAAAFPQSPTPWEAVTHLYELGRPHERADHPDRLLTERLIRGFLAGLGERSEAEILALLARSAGSAGMEQDEALHALLAGSADFPGEDDGTPFGDRARAAIGRIAAQYDGGMIHED